MSTKIARELGDFHANITNLHLHTWAAASAAAGQKWLMHKKWKRRQEKNRFIFFQKYERALNNMAGVQVKTLTEIFPTFVKQIIIKAFLPVFERPCTQIGRKERRRRHPKNWIFGTFFFSISICGRGGGMATSRSLPGVGVGERREEQEYFFRLSGRREFNSKRGASRRDT